MAVFSSENILVANTSMSYIQYKIIILDVKELIKKKTHLKLDLNIQNVINLFFGTPEHNYDMTIGCNQAPTHTV